MAMTVKGLIHQLQSSHDLDEPIVFQYVVAEHTNLEEDKFAEVADYLMGNSNFADDASEVFISWIAEAESVLDEAEEEE